MPFKKEVLDAIAGLDEPEVLAVPPKEDAPPPPPPDKVPED